MRTINLKKRASLPTANELLDNKYGKEGSESRVRFDNEAKNWYGLQTER